MGNYTDYMMFCARLYCPCELFCFIRLHGVQLFAEFFDFL